MCNLICGLNVTVSVTLFVNCYDYYSCYIFFCVTRQVLFDVIISPSVLDIIVDQNMLNSINH